MTIINNILYSISYPSFKNEVDFFNRWSTEMRGTSFGLSSTEPREKEVDGTGTGATRKKVTQIEIKKCS
jgi:hypothetical protein